MGSYSSAREDRTTVDERIRELEALKAEDDLEKLEELLSRFNIWRALDLTRQEVRHSGFLRWLFDPGETHGAGPHFLRAFLENVIPDGPKDYERWPPANQDLKLGKHAEVVAEWPFLLRDWESGEEDAGTGRDRQGRIDILIHSPEDRLICVVENKVDSNEHSKQLDAYQRAVEEKYGARSDDYWFCFVYLTKEGSKPRNPHYKRWGYGAAAELVEAALGTFDGSLDSEVRWFIEQYVETVRRFIVKDSKVQKLAREIYRKHRRALDEIMKQSDYRKTEVAEIVRSLIMDWAREERGKEVLDWVGPENDRYLRLMFKAMDVVPVGDGPKWADGRLLFWELVNHDSQVRVQLSLNGTNNSIRAAVEEVALSNPELFGKARNQRGAAWQLFRPPHLFDAPPGDFPEVWVREEEYDEISEEELRARVRENLKSIRDNKVQPMADLLRAGLAKVS